MHANFIVNEGGATPRDVVELIEEVRARVLEARGLRLATEIKIFGDPEREPPVRAEERNRLAARMTARPPRREEVRPC